MNQVSNLAPESRRIALLDVYRGFAIFGIFVVNIEIMNCIPLNQDGYYTSFQDFWNQLADQIRRLFFYSKFFPIFSLLFGLGVAMQIQKRKHLGFSFGRFISWRMSILLLIGIGHILFLWSGDVVHMYAIIGFFVSFIHRYPKKNIIIASFLLLLGFSWIGQWLLDSMLYLFGQFGLDPKLEFDSRYSPEQIPGIIANESYASGIEFRFYDYLLNLPLAYSYFFPLALSMITLGVGLAKTSFLRKPQEMIDRIKIPVLIVALLSNLYRLFFLYVVLEQGWHRTENWGPWLLWLMPICDVLMGVFYLWLIGWLYRYSWVQKALSPLAYVGKMALSNYLLQSLFALILFTAVGFSAYMELSQWETLLVALAFFPVQVILSKWWLSYFRFGLIEWLWRCLTYRKWIPLKQKV